MNELHSSDIIDVKTAIRSAKTILSDLLEGEVYSQLGLEEVVYLDYDKGWLVTLGYNRPWDVEKQTTPTSRSIGGINFPATTTTNTKQNRTFKKLLIDSRTGDFISMKD